MCYRVGDTMGRISVFNYGSDGDSCNDCNGCNDDGDDGDVVVLLMVK